MKNIKSLLTIAALLTVASASQASGNHGSAHDAKPAPVATKIATATTTTTTAAAVLPKVSAEVRKVDLENSKISLKHADIPNLDMPGMSMVFQVKNVAMLENVKAGDKVMFTADKVDGAFMVMSIEKAK
jgi:Cu(I)/Ag(I) efflux system periplasmic protein CusF